MNKVIGVYETQTEAADAAKTLQDAGFAPETISIYNRDSLSNKHIHVRMSHRFEIFEMGAGVVLGALLGGLSGAGFFRVPAFWFIYNHGPVRGLFAGAIFGLLISVAIALVTSLIIHWQTVARNEKHLNEGKFLLFL